MLRASPVLRRAIRSSLVPLRRYSLQGPAQNPRGQANPFIQDHFVSSAGIAINLFTRFVKFSLLGALGLGLTSWTIFEGTHLWVESVELASGSDEETRRWEWDRDAEKWTGGEQGGTDPALGFRARHLLRGSWIAENWGVGSTTFLDYGGAGSFNVVEARLDFARNYLDMTSKIAETKLASGKLRPQTNNDLLLRHGAILERIGTKEALFEARSKYERVWAGLPDKGTDAASLASKLGNLNFRLGNSNHAVSWWTRALGLLQQIESSATPTIPKSVPSSPSAQRTLTSTLVSLSAYYSTSGELKQARQLQETALALLRSVPSPPDIAATSPPQMLHFLHLLHRSSLISIHLAEVLYALRSPRQSSFDYLSRAAESSERVALALAGLPFSPPDTKGSGIAHTPAPDARVLPSFAKSRVMRKPATGLLRDARRTAAEAWNLMGILNEQGGEMERALACYERAVGWAGVTSDQDIPGEGTLETDWKLMWTNYSRTRDTVQKLEKR
ncbi:hypothetical protein JVU11DRAFT_567 [Chiua virens]|nr:hypothetical protein JVU11DRAFT_567 [Chiua virens]